MLQCPGHRKINRGGNTTSPVLPPQLPFVDFRSACCCAPLLLLLLLAGVGRRAVPGKGRASMLPVRQVRRLPIPTRESAEYPPAAFARPACLSACLPIFPEHRADVHTVRSSGITWAAIRPAETTPQLSSPVPCPCMLTRNTTAPCRLWLQQMVSAFSNLPQDPADF